MLTADVTPEAVALLSAVLWAVSFTLATPVSRREGALRLVGTRTLLSAVGLLLLAPFFLTWRDVSSLDWRSVAVFALISGPLIGGGSVLLFVATQEIGLAHALPVSSTYPLITTLAAIAWMGERPTRWQVAGGFAVVVGVSLISSSRATVRGGVGRRALFRRAGFWYATLASVLWAGNILLVKVELGRGMHPLIGNLLRMPTIFVLTALALRRERRSPWGMSPRSWGITALVALLGPVVGDGLFLWALQQGSASIVAPLLATSPLWSLPIARFFLHEPLNWRVVLGAVLTVAGIVLTV